MKRLCIVLIAVLLISCTAPPLPETNDTVETEDFGDILNFTFASTNISLSESIVVTSVNTTKEVYLFSYCGIPVSMVRHIKGGTYLYVYPHIDDCVEPENTTFSPNLTIPLSQIPTRDGPLIPGTYRVKLFYSTVAPGVYMRENNQIITIRES